MTIEFEKTTAVRIKVNVEGTIEQYATAFLAIYNNVKSSSKLLKMYNNYSNGIYLVCEANEKDNAIDFLEQFGEITNVDTVKVIQPYLNNYDYSEEIEILDVEE